MTVDPRCYIVMSMADYHRLREQKGEIRAWEAKHAYPEGVYAIGDLGASLHYALAEIAEEFRRRWLPHIPPRDDIGVVRIPIKDFPALGITLPALMEWQQTIQAEERILRREPCMRPGENCMRFVFLTTAAATLFKLRWL